MDWVCLYDIFFGLFMSCCLQFSSNIDLVLQLMSLSYIWHLYIVKQTYALLHRCQIHLLMKIA